MHVLVLGCGPAGLSLAAELAERGASVTSIAPEPEKPWENRYAAWRDELPEHATWVARTWPTATVVAEREHTWQRAYAAVDGPGLQRALLARLHAAGGQRRAGVAMTATPTGATLNTGEFVHAEVVVDASGSGQLARPGGRAPTVWQSAWGAELNADALGEGLAGGRWAASAMRLMDFSGPAEVGPPSFLYAMPYGGGRWFVEETVLAGPAVDFDVLKARAVRRLAAIGVEPGWELEAVGEERCRIPMDIAPVTSGSLFAFGASAGMIHPATGFSVARTMALAPKVAEAIVAGGGDLDLAWRALWPGDALACDALYRFGGEVLAGLDLEQTRTFFEAFAQLPAELRDGYQSRRLTRRELAQAMWRVFGRTSWGMRRILTLAGTRRAPTLASALFSRH